MKTRIRNSGTDATAFRPGSVGFTVIEVMIAIGIFSMIIISIYSVWTGILKASKAARTAADSAQRARISMRALQDALTTAPTGERLALTVALANQEWWLGGHEDARRRLHLASACGWHSRSPR